MIVILNKAHDPFEICHDLLPGCDLSVENSWYRAVIPKVCSADHQIILSGLQTEKVWEPLI